MTSKLSLKEAAFLIGVHWRTLYRWTLEGKIDYIQPRNYSRIYIPESEIKRVCAKKTNASIRRFSVYFIQAGENGLIKIGTTNFIKQRFDILQKESPVPLKVLALTDQTSENYMHEKFAKYRKYGGWFEPAEELVNFINKLESDTN